MSLKTINVPINRVEGDLDIKVELDGGAVKDAWCSGTMFRGFENLMAGRGALDGLVITPRICGICTTTHLTAAVKALDMISGAKVPDDALRIRNLALMTEHIQSDVRHGLLMFCADFTNEAYKGNSLFAEAVRRYAPLMGKSASEVLRESKRVLEIIAILGGQWPHSSFMVPGGVVSLPSPGDILQCRHLLSGFRNWYEGRVLGCSIERWRDVKDASALDAWLDESDLHRNSDLGFYIRFAREAGLTGMGRGHGNFLSYGSLDMPGGGKLIAPGFAVGTDVRPFDQKNISEHIAHSWFTGYDGGRHPSAGETRPYATGYEGKKYSWAKAPRYDGLPAETGPLAEMVIGKDPLFTDLVGRGGPDVFIRELARLTRPTTLIPMMETWLLGMFTNGGGCYNAPEPIEEGEGFGLIEAARGALGHWVKVADSKIEHYQIITPTAWHASPRDSEGTRGTFEEALVGTKVRDPENPVELGHVVRSFDACLVCTVHAIEPGKDSRRFKLAI